MVVILVFVFLVLNIVRLRGSATLNGNEITTGSGRRLPF
jgi:hypothetical protein